MRPGLIDLFSYKSRATKRLLRILMRLAETVAESKLVGEEAITLEVWFACIAPVSQGYWRSAISERTKKLVLDEFYGHAFDIIINDILIPSSQFKSAGPAEQDLLLQGIHVDVRRSTACAGSCRNCSLCGNASVLSTDDSIAIRDTTTTCGDPSSTKWSDTSKTSRDPHRAPLKISIESLERDARQRARPGRWLACNTTRPSFS